MPSRYAISLATVVMLVVLRVNIGWHFFSEGMKHHADPNWTSAPVLRAAKGPLAPLYHSYLDGFHGFEKAMHAPVAVPGESGAKSVAEAEAKNVEKWVEQIHEDWGKERDAFAARHALDETQGKQSSQLLKEAQGKVSDWAEANKEPLVGYVHQWQRRENKRAEAAAEVPFETKRIAAKQAELSGQSGSWLAELGHMETDYRAALDHLLTDEQAKAHPPARPSGSIRTVDFVMTYAILGIGLLLIVGLLTRTACVAGALFLLSVVMMQPFWVSETAPTFNQYVEMFALLTLATTSVGRWAGLDFFLSKPTSPRGLPSKGVSDASH